MTQTIHPMLERLASALEEHGVDEDMANLRPDIVPHVKQAWIDLARAAVHALMEPDEGMLSAAREVDSENGWSNNPENIWAAMLRPLIEGEGE